MSIKIIVYLSLSLNLNYLFFKLSLTILIFLKVNQFPQNEVALLVLQHFKQSRLLELIALHVPEHTGLHWYIKIPVTLFEHLLYHLWGMFGQTHVFHVHVHEFQQIVVLEVRVEFQEGLDDLVALLVLDQQWQFAHQCLDHVIHDVDREMFNTDVQDPTALYILRQTNTVVSDDI